MTLEIGRARSAEPRESDAEDSGETGAAQPPASLSPARPASQGATFVDRVENHAMTADLWVSDTLGGARHDDDVALSRLRGLALAGAAITLPMSAWKVIGPITTADLFLVAAVVLFFPRFELAAARRLWFLALAIALAAVGGVIGTVVTGSDAVASAEILARFLAASIGAMVLVACWRPGLEQARSFGSLWVAGGVASGLVALIIPDLHMFLRPSGLTPHPNHLAIISVILLGVALALVISDRAREHGLSGLHALAGLGAAGVLFAAIVASGSRAGLGAALVVGFLVILSTRERSVVRVAVGLAAIGLVVVVLGLAGEDNALDRTIGGDESSAEARQEHNAAAWDRFVDDPITGVGFGDVTDAHIFLLQFASAAGVLGIVAGLMLVFLALRTYVVAVWRRMADDPPRWAMVAGFAAAVIGYLAASVFQNVLWDRNVWLAFVLMTWLAALPVLARD
jgi:O-antigen ligase